MCVLFWTQSARIYIYIYSCLRIFRFSGYEIWTQFLAIASPRDKHPVKKGATERVFLILSMPAERACRFELETMQTPEPNRKRTGKFKILQFLGFPTILAKFHKVGVEREGRKARCVSVVHKIDGGRAARIPMHANRRTNGRRAKKIAAYATDASGIDRQAWPGRRENPRWNIIALVSTSWDQVHCLRPFRKETHPNHVRSGKLGDATCIKYAGYRAREGPCRAA